VAITRIERVFLDLVVDVDDRQTLARLEHFVA